MVQPYSLEDVARSFKWLDHKAYTELVALHPDYKPGKENLQQNHKHNLFPRICYAGTEKEVVEFVRQYAVSHMVCYSLNPRQKIFRDRKGNIRSAREHEIEVSQNMVLDFDLVAHNITHAHLRAFEAFLYRAYEYFRDRGTQLPATAFTGRGYHLLFAYSPIKVHEYPDIAVRLKQFGDNFRQAFRQELDRLEGKLDSTQDLRRCLKIYGTAKPEVGILSRWHGTERVEDLFLREHLLGMKVSEAGEQSPVALKPMDTPPAWFEKLLETDSRIKALWLGTGKPEDSDISRTGYDYSLARKLFGMGYRNIDELATILVLRPEGAVRKSGKGEQYIRRTIANAILG